MRVVAIDYGRARLGLAITDNSKTIAYPLKVVKAKKDIKKTAKTLLENLSEHIKEIEVIIIGLPLLLDGTKGDMANEVIEFAEALKEITSIKIEFLDERLTSSQAERDLKDTFKLNRKKRAAKSDTMAATIILQNYISRFY